MHYRFLVTYEQDTGDTSKNAREHVWQMLHEEGFCTQAGRWGRGLADWFVIGGRWSGALSHYSWAKEITAQMQALEQEHDVQVWGVFYADPATQRIQQELAARFQQLWDAQAPEPYKGIPIQRDTHADTGYEDDAMPLTQELYDALLKEYEGQEDSEYHADLDWEPIHPDMVGRKWIVVVDYHK